VLSLALIEVRNPATGDIAGRVSEAGPTEIRDTVLRAREAQRFWRKLDFASRAAVVRRFHDLILDRRRLILDTIQSETGKARRDGLMELLTVAGTARYYLAHGRKHISAERRQPAVPGVSRAEIIHKPHGVVGLITPWNHPFLLSIGDALPALLAGNAVIVKPSERTPLSAVLARQLLIESGLNANLIGVLHGPGSVGAELIDHVDYIGFTGGTETGRKVAVRAAERLIPSCLELGGKNPMVVLRGAPLDDAARGLVVGAFSNSGQTCIAVERVYVEESIYGDFARKVAEQASQLKLGWSLDWDIDMGSLISEAHADRVLGYVDDAVSSGAKILAGGRRRRDLGPAFVEPTILECVSEAMPIAKEETFGPVVSLFPVRDADEAVLLANTSSYGLNSSVWAERTNKAREVVSQLETGSAVINSTLLIYNSFDVPMGGVKQSGIGRRHAEQGIRRYTQPQAIVSSVASGGGYDGVALRIRNQKAAELIVKLLRWWRKIPGLR
jgi:succinate-semialdehyde dehydrogenase/glutarate-semialdehyde dehydrogenase